MKSISMICKEMCHSLCVITWALFKSMLLCVIVWHHANSQDKVARLTIDQRNEAVGMLRNASTNAVAHRRTIERPARKRRDTVSVPRSGRPRVTTAAEDRAIRTAHLRRRFQTAAATSRQWVGGQVISCHTVRRRLKDEGISCKRPMNKDGL